MLSNIQVLVGTTSSPRDQPLPFLVQLDALFVKRVLTWHCIKQVRCLVRPWGFTGLSFFSGSYASRIECSLTRQRMSQLTSNHNLICDSEFHSMHVSLMRAKTPIPKLVCAINLHYVVSQAETLGCFPVEPTHSGPFVSSHNTKEDSRPSHPPGRYPKCTLDVFHQNCPQHTE